MAPIKVIAYPSADRFPLISATVANAEADPESSILPVARRDAASLEGATFVDACWTFLEWRIQFDCDIRMRIWIGQHGLRWSIDPSAFIPPESGFEHVGAPPVTLDWAKTIGPREMNRSLFVTKRSGARFKDLCIN